MLAGELAHILRNVRVHAPKTVRSAVTVLEKGLADFLGTVACVLELPAEKVVYLSRSLPGLTRDELKRAIGLDFDKIYKWTILADNGDDSDIGGDSLSVFRIPLYCGNEKFGWFSVLSSSQVSLDPESIISLSEVLSSILVQFLPGKESLPKEDRNESLKIELLEAARDEMMMKGVLLKMMEISGAEFCAYYCQSGERVLHAMLDSRELVQRLPEIRDRLAGAFDMFSNITEDPGLCREKVYYRNIEKNLAYLVGNNQIESYFLVPVTFDFRVRGVLFFGSVREDAFVRENISFFRSMAEDGDDRQQMMYMLSGELTVLRETIGQLPVGCALVSREGSIVDSNGMFGDILGIDGPVPDNFHDIERLSSFSLEGLWSEMSLLGGYLRGRQLFGKEKKDSCISIDWVRLDRISREVGSILVVRDISPQIEKEKAVEELMATVAHELRTPMTALKNSIRIMADGELSDSRFAGTALRTIDRLNLLVNGLVDSTDIRRKDRDLELRQIKVESLIEDASLFFRKSMEKKEIGFQVKIDPGLSEIFADRNRLEQVIQNLLSNSLKHVPSCGSVEIVVRRAGSETAGIPVGSIAGLVEQPRFVEILVSDSGSGLPIDVMTGINDMFDTGMKSERPSKGLGLLIAGRLIRMHGGSMNVVETGGEGTTISLCIPADEATSGAVLAWSRITATLSDILDRGYSPSVVALEKTGVGCWIDILAGLALDPIVEPDAGKTIGEGRYFWPVSETLALCVELGKAAELPDDRYEEAGIKVSRVSFPEGGRDAQTLVINCIDKVASETVGVV